jgi:methionyl-tRNA synthetase
LDDKSKSHHEPYFITTAIPYVNARPHIGFALELVQADAFARYHRSIGQDVRFLTGTDENALKNVQAAEAAGISTRELVDQNASIFRALREQLHLSFDDFIRTSAEERHLLGAQKLWRAAQASGDIYKKSYTGLYCVGCEQFYAPDELTADGLCPEHLTRPERVEEENYFFRLSRYEQQLLSLIESGHLRIIPESRRNEVLSFIRMGLEDFSISRSMERARGWGVPVPDDPSQVMYVWFDALTNYITALDYANDGELFHRYWEESPNRVNCIGKGVIRFHAVYWPAMLMSVGVKPPSVVFVHGYMTANGQKMSKSLGNVIDPADLVDKYGAEAVRYYLLREVPATGDSDFTYDKFENRYNSDLANDLGNLLNRTVSMIGRYRDGQIPEPGANDVLDDELRLVAFEIPRDYDTAMEAYDPQEALEALWRLVTRANQYAEQTSPWTLAKAARNGDPDSASRLDSVLYNMAESLRLLAVYLSPFLPTTAEQILFQLGQDAELLSQPGTNRQWGGTQAGSQVGSPTPLFPRLA